MSIADNKLFSNFLENRTAQLLLLLLIAVGISFQSYFLGLYDFMGGKYTHYNNYIIFKNSFAHLLNNENLYLNFPSEHADLYKYSPTFAAVMGLFYYLPDLPGLILWNTLNILVFFFAIYSLQSLDSRYKFYVILFVLIELILSVQNSQSNGLIAGLMIMTFSSMERDKPAQATLWIVLGSVIKIFSIAGCLLLLFYPKKIKSLAYLAMWLVIFTFLPLIFIDVHQLYNQYLNWGQLLMNDHSQSLGYSIYRYTSFIMNDDVNKKVMLFFGIALLLTPIAFTKEFRKINFRLSYLCLLLIWLVVFNHKAESPAFVIAMAGCAIWGMSGKMTKSKRLILILTFVLTSLTSTDLLPIAVKKNYIDMSLLKPLMSVVVMFVIYAGLMTKRNQDLTAN